MRTSEAKVLFFSPLRYYAAFFSFVACAFVRDVLADQLPTLLSSRYAGIYLKKIVCTCEV